MIARLVAAATIAAAGAVVYALGGGPVLAAIVRQLVRELT